MAAGAVCRAPFGTFELDPRGFVLPCCVNTAYPLGNITETRLPEIWNGPRAAALREAMRRHDFSYGCGSCRWQLDHGKSEPVLRQYDRLGTEDDLVWPVEIGFALSNVCNLECAQCNGEYSSRIRATREHRPPLKSVYGDEFFADLRAFLPHLRSARFVGGEPFLMRENFRIWDMLIDDGLRPECHVTTNGTRLDARVERVLEHLPVSIILSIDSPRKDTFEAIRLNADFDEVVANGERFRRYCAEAGTSFVVNHCLMRNNWHEFADMLRMAEAWDCELNTSTVFNEPFSLYKAPLDELAHVVATMEAQEADGLLPEIPRNVSVWHAELSQLRQTLAERRAGVDEAILATMDGWAGGGLLPSDAEVSLVRPSASPERRVRLRSRRRRRAIDAVVRELEIWAGDRVAVLDVGPDGVVVGVEGRGASFYGLEAGNSLGHHLDDCVEALRHRLGPHLIVMDRHASAGRFEALLGYANTPPYEKQGTFVRLVALPTDADGSWTVVLGSDEIYPVVPLPEDRTSSEPLEVPFLSPAG